MDVSTRKTCIGALAKLVKLWGSDPSFKSFAIESIGVGCCMRGTVNGTVDVRDGSVLGLLSEVWSLDMTQSAKITVLRFHMDQETDDQTPREDSCLSTGSSMYRDSARALWGRLHACGRQIH